MQTYSSNKVTAAYLLFCFGLFFLIGAGFYEGMSGDTSIWNEWPVIPVFAGASLSLWTAFLFWRANRQAFSIGKFFTMVGIAIPGLLTLWLLVVLLLAELGI